MLPRALFTACMVILIGMPCANLYAQDTSAEYETYFRVRLGQGGFRDSRSPIGKLGGGQITLDIRPDNSSVAFSVSSEYYTNSPYPSHSYEISNLIAFNILFMEKLLTFEKAEYFIGAGFGQLEVPDDDENSEDTVSGHHYNAEAGIHYQYFRKVGFYGLYKYLYAEKESNNVKVIDFNENIILLGITFHFIL